MNAYSLPPHPAVNPRDIEPRARPMPEESTMTESHTVYYGICRECGTHYYSFDEGVCPRCGNEDYTEIAQVTVNVVLDQITGDLELTVQGGFV